MAMRLLSNAIAAICLAAIIPAAAIAADKPLATDDFRLFMPRFSGPEAIGAGVTAVLNLRLWRTLRKASPGLLPHTNFGNGAIVWADHVFHDPAAESAVAALSVTDSDMVLWGRAEQYGNDIIVQSFLLTRATRLNDDAPRGADWSLVVGGVPIALAPPDRLYRFGTLVLRPELVAAFTDFTAMRLCTVPKGPCSGPEVGPAMHAIEHDGSWTKLRTPDGRTGWLNLQQLGTEPDEIVTFTGALISYYRGDLEQADTLFGAAAETASADSLVRDDATLLLATTHARLGRDPWPILERFRALDPYSRYAFQVAVMSCFQDVATHRPGSLIKAHRLALELAAKRGLFNEGDEWLKSASKIFEQIS